MVVVSIKLIIPNHADLWGQQTINEIPLIRQTSWTADCPCGWAFNGDSYEEAVAFIELHNEFHDEHYDLDHMEVYALV